MTTTTSDGGAGSGPPRPLAVLREAIVTAWWSLRLTIAAYRDDRRSQR